MDKKKYGPLRIKLILLNLNGLSMKGSFTKNSFYFIILTLFYCGNVLSQNHIVDYKTYKFRKIGVVDHQSIFQFIRKNKSDTRIKKNGATPGSLYSFNIDHNKQLQFFEYRKVPLEQGNIVFIKDNKQVSIAYSINKTYSFYVFKDNSYDLIDLGLGGGFASNFSYYEPKSFLFFSGFSEYKYLNMLNFSEDEIEVTNLNLFSSLSKVMDDYLFFDSNHIAEDKTTPTPVDLYRVKIGDWNNPELLVEFISDSWLPLNDSIVLLTVPIKGRGKQVFYNINQKTYASVKEELPTTKVLYEGKEFLLDNVKVGLDRRYKLVE